MWSIHRARYQEGSGVKYTALIPSITHAITWYTISLCTLCDEVTLGSFVMLGHVLRTIGMAVVLGEDEDATRH